MISIILIKRILLFHALLIGFTPYCYSQCNYSWATWTDQGSTDTAVASLIVNGYTINMSMTANYNFAFTSGIYSYGNFSAYPDPPIDATVPQTTWAAGPGGQTTMCFSEPVVNPVLLLASIGNPSETVTLTFSLPYLINFDGGGTVYDDSVTLTGNEGFCILEFPGTFTCITIFSSTPEYYTNLTWGIKNPLTAGFTFSNQCQNSAVSFSSATSYINFPGTIDAYYWDFGDGDTSTLANPTHIFPSVGNFNVELVIVSDNLCTDTLSQLVTVNPTFNTNNPQTICNGQVYSINAPTTQPLEHTTTHFFQPKVATV